VPLRLLVVLLAGCAVATDSVCGPPAATVARTIDGDTIVLDDGTRIRYLLVDTPEASKCFAAEATAFNAAMVVGHTVELGYDVQCSDRYGRTLAYVAVDGDDVNRALVTRGYGCVLHIPPDGDARAAEFESLEATARAAHVGLWGACDPVPCR
jgi:micrococcal nuclease